MSRTKTYTTTVSRCTHCYHHNHRPVPSRPAASHPAPHTELPLPQVLYSFLYYSSLVSDFDLPLRTLVNCITPTQLLVIVYSGVTGVPARSSFLLRRFPVAENGELRGEVKEIHHLPAQLTSQFFFSFFFFLRDS